MRVLATVERYAPAIGGAERVVQRLAEGLAARGHELHVLTGGPTAREQLNGVNVYRVPLRGNEVRGIRGDPSAVTRLIAELNPDVLFNYAAQTWATDCCFHLLRQKKRPRMVLAPCGFSGLRSRRYASYFAKMPERLRSYDAVILHSSTYQDWDFTVAADVKVRCVVPNGADPPASPRRGTGSKLTKRAVTVGSHVRSKGHAGFAQAVRTLARRYPLHGHVVAPPRGGLGALRGCQLACEARARLQPIRIVDGSAPGVVVQEIADADMFLFTSRLECAPLVILEAMAAATPWVSYDVGNVTELAGGLVVRDRASLHASASAILAGEHPGLGAEGQARWRERHRWEQIVPQYESIFMGLLDGSPAVGPSQRGRENRLH